MTFGPLPFIGRRHELEALDAAFGYAAKGEPSLVQIAAEAGFGKTRLVDEALRRLDPSTRVVHVSSFEGDHRAYSLSNRLIDHLNRALGAETQPVEAERAELALTAGVERLCANAVGVIVLEDLHWADTLSLEVLLPVASQLATLARRPLGAHLAVVTTYRPFELADRSRSVLERLGRQLPRAWQLTPRPLTPVEVNALMVGMGYQRPSGRLLTRLMDVCAGNPLHVQTVVTQLDRTDRLIRRGGTTDLLGSDVPADLGLGLTAAIEQRLSLLAPPSADLLAIAALLDPPVNPQTLATLAELDLGETFDRLAPAVSEHLIDVDTEVMSFHHPLLRTLLPRRFSPVLRSRLESRIAEQLLLDVARPGPTLVSAAQHLSRALLTERPELVADVCSRAAATARDLGDYGSTAELAETALHAAQLIPQPDGVPPPALALEMTRLHLLAAFGHYRHHDRSAWEAHIAAAQAGTGPGHDTALSCEVELLAARARMTFGPLPVDESPLLALLENLDGDDPLTGRIHQTLAEIRFGTGRYEQGRADAGLALAIAERYHYPADEAKAVFARGLNAWATLDLDVARASFESCERLSLLSDDRWLTTWGRGRLGLVSHMEGRVDETLRDTAEHYVRAEAFGDWSELALASALRVAALTFRGEASEAEEEAARALALSARGDYVWAPTILVPALTCLRAERGDGAGAMAALAHYETTGQRAPRIFQQLVALTLGDLDTTRAHFVPRKLQTGVTALTLTGYCAYGAAAVALGERQCIEWFLDDMIDVAQRGVLVPIAWNVLVPRLVGSALAACGNLDEARSRLTGAVERATLAGAIPELGRTWLALAQLHSQAGALEDRDEARRCVARAVAIGRRLGLRPLERKAVDLGLTLGRFEGDVEALLSTEDAIGPPLLGAVLFTDVVGSTQLQRQATDTSWARLLGEHDRRLRACVGRFGGIEFTHTGDGLGAFFSTAENAVGCALATHQSLASIEGAPGGGLPIRVGVCWGEARPRGRDLAGQNIARTVRVMSFGGAGQTIVDSAVATRLGHGWDLRSVGRPPLKGFEDLADELFTVGRTVAGTGTQ